MSSTQCPACGSPEVAVETSVRSYTAPFGPTKQYELPTYRCRTCGEHGDFGNTQSAVIRSAMESADRESIPPLLDALAAAGVSMAYVERVLGLPPRTLARWKAGECSAAGLALLRLVRAFPWVLQAAAARFSPAECQRLLLKAAGAALAATVTASGLKCSVVATKTSDASLEITAVFQAPRATVAATGGEPASSAPLPLAA